MNSLLKIATKQARQSEVRCQHGAVVSRGGSILSAAHNTYNKHPRWGSGPMYSIHAEAAAIRTAVRKGIDLRGATIVVVRTGNTSQMSKPCEACQALIEKYGIRKVRYTDEDGNIITEIPL